MGIFCLQGVSHFVQLATCHSIAICNKSPYLIWSSRFLQRFEIVVIREGNSFVTSCRSTVVKHNQRTFAWRRWHHWADCFITPRWQCIMENSHDPLESVWPWLTRCGNVSHSDYELRNEIFNGTCSSSMDVEQWNLWRHSFTRHSYHDMLPGAENLLQSSRDLVFKPVMRTQVDDQKHWISLLISIYNTIAEVILKYCTFENDKMLRIRATAAKSYIYIYINICMYYFTILLIHLGQETLADNG